MEEFLDRLFQGQDLLVLVIAMVALFAGTRLLPRLISGGPMVQPAEVQRRLEAGEDALILDVRQPGEFNDALGHVPGALNLPLGELSGRLDALKADLAPYAGTPVYVLCRTASRAASASRLLRRAGLTKVAVVAGGMVKWNRQKLPVSRG